MNLRIPPFAPHPVRLFGSLALLLGAIGTGIPPAHAEGSRSLYPSSTSGLAYRANLEWRTDKYGGLVTRRTLIKVFAQQGENILVGSSAIGVDSGNILIYNPGAVSNSQIGSEVIPTLTTSNGFDCVTQAAGTGFIASRTAELAGPKSVDGTGNTTGYTPCVYAAPSTGVYDVVFYGTAGGNNASNGGPTGEIALTSSSNFDNSQGSTVAAWDVTIRSSSANSTVDLPGRAFTYYLAMFTSGNGRPVYFSTYPITNDGFQYEVDLRGTDPNGFVVYGNQVGFFDSDGTSPLYHDVLGSDGQLTSIAGGASLARPQYATFFNPIAPAVLSYIARFDPNGTFLGTGITATPIPPTATGLTFVGNVSGSTSVLGMGGTFTFTSANASNYAIIISRDGVNFDPTNPNNRVLRGIVSSSSQTVPWDGKDNSGNDFPVGANYPSRLATNGGEYHFPLLDAENSVSGGPTITLLNSTNPLGNTAAFYDDRGYRLANGQPVGTSGQVLCGTAPPTLIYSGAPGLFASFDTATNNRAFGTASGGNTNVACTGSFGDTKGLDLWTYYPSVAVSSSVTIIASPATIGVAKQAGTVVYNGNGTYTVPLTVTLGNYGTDALNNVQVTENLLDAFLPFTGANIVGVTTPVVTVTTAGTGTTATSLTSAGSAFTGRGGTANSNGANNLLAGGTGSRLAVGARATITFNVTIQTNTPATYNNTVTATGTSVSDSSKNTRDNSTDGLDPDSTVNGGAANGNGDPTDNTSPTPITITVPPAQLRLVKRITRINNTAITAMIDDPTSTDDNAPGWPANYLQGAIDGGKVKSQDILEYTIYFLSDGGNGANSVTLCDLVPANTQFIPNSYNGLTPTDGGSGTDLGIMLQVTTNSTTTRYLSGMSDPPDRGSFVAAGGTVPAICSATKTSTGTVVVPSTGTNANGAVIIQNVSGNSFNLSPGTYGFFRFRAQVN